MFYPGALALSKIEIAFNKILRRIWRLPYRTHTRILHLVASLDSLFNVVYQRSASLLRAASSCPSPLVRTIFRDSSFKCFTFCGYNSMYGSRHIKLYSPQDKLCATIVRSFRSASDAPQYTEDMIWTICCI